MLAAGWGDTYAQFRAGQSFRLKGLPNGVYYIEVKGNPNGKLVESSTEDNVALRKIILSGKPGARKVDGAPGRHHRGGPRTSSTTDPTDRALTRH